MIKKLSRKKRIFAALHDSADAISPSPLTCQSILAGVMPEAVRQGRVSYGAAREKANNLARKKATGRRQSVAAALGLTVLTVGLLLFVKSGGPLSLIPEDEVPLAFAPATLKIDCQTVDGGYVHVRMTGSEDVSWQSIYALDKNERYISPYAVYPELRMVVFAPPKGDIVIYAPLVSGLVASCEYIKD